MAPAIKVSIEALPAVLTVGKAMALSAVLALPVYPLAGTVQPAALALNLIVPMVRAVARVVAEIQAPTLRGPAVLMVAVLAALRVWGV